MTKHHKPSNVLNVCFHKQQGQLLLETARFTPAIAAPMEQYGCVYAALQDTMVGLPQTFVIEALDPITGKTRLHGTTNDTDGVVTFKLDLGQLPSVNDADGSTFNLLIYARNLKGESEKTLLENIAFNDAARRTDGKSAIGNITLGIAVAAALGATLAAGGIASLALYARKRRAQPPNKHPPGDMLELSDGGRRYVVAYTIKPSPDLKTPDPQPDILNAPGKNNHSIITLKV
ncbi:hypothetical protein ACJJTC_013138 [Scirpophaga incertulas]